MKANDGQDQAQRFKRLATVFPGEWVLFHDPPFLGGEVGTLFQDLVGNRDFSQVVQITAATQGNNLLFLKADVAPQGLGTFRETLAMTFGIGITRFDAAAQGAKHGLRGFQFVGEFL